MRLALTISALAAIMLIGGSDPAAAKQWCLHDGQIGKVKCTYGTLEACKKIARPGSGFCLQNPGFARARPPAPATTGAPAGQPVILGVSGTGAYCLHDANVSRVNCNYNTLAACNTFRRPGAAFCTPNRWW